MKNKTKKKKKRKKKKRKKKEKLKVNQDVLPIFLAVDPIMKKEMKGEKIQEKIENEN